MVAMIVEEYTKAEVQLKNRIADIDYKTLKIVLAINSDSTARNKVKGYNPLSIEEMIALSSHLGLNTKPFEDFKKIKDRLSIFIDNTELNKSFFLKALGDKDNRYLSDRLKNPALWNVEDINNVNNAITKFKKTLEL
jgi:hypothetical protein